MPRSAVQRSLVVLIGFLGVLIPFVWQRPLALHAQSTTLAPVVRYAERFDTSPPLGTLAQNAPMTTPSTWERLHLRKPSTTAPTPFARQRDPVVQSVMPDIAMPEPLMSFDGIANLTTILPPDPSGAIGYDAVTGRKFFMQWVNTAFAIWDVSTLTPTLLIGPVAGNTLWAGFGGLCETNNDGDPIVLFDHLAQRWLVGQFALGFPTNFHQCLAVSQTADPTGAWYRYDFDMGDAMNDYPKLAVWPEAYLLTVNQFDGSTLAWRGQGVAALERARMLEGQNARMVFFDLYDVNPNFGGMLPADLDGPPPPAGTPAVFVEMDDDAWGWATDRLSLWHLSVDWNTPENATFGVDGAPNQILDTQPFDADMCGGSRNCIPQPGGVPLDTVADRLMYRAAYRWFGSYGAMVLNHTVDADGSDHAGIRWYELRHVAGTWSIYQQGTFAPDSAHRWMGSIAMDKQGNIALGYAVSSPTTFPSVRYTGRFAGDPLGQMTLAEASLVEGGGYQTSSSGRFGDYSMLTLDPQDDCTFWYTQEYYAAPGTSNWRTRIGAFRFPTCTTRPTGTVAGTVREADGTPVVGARVQIGFFSAESQSDGHFRLENVPTGTYTVTVSAYGYVPLTQTNVVVNEGLTTTLAFTLTSAPTYVVSGTVRDARTGQPLYAQILIPQAPVGAVWTNPTTGFYSVTLAAQIAYTFEVHAWVDGYNTERRAVGPLTAPQQEDFALLVNETTCNAPGYHRVQTLVLDEHFETGTTPTGWQVLDNRGGGAVWRFDDPGGRGNLTGSVGGFAIVDSDFYGSNSFQDTELRTPVVNIAGLDGVMLAFNTDVQRNSSEVMRVDVRVDGGAWQTVWENKSGSSNVNGRVSLDLSDQTAGATTLQARFHYFDADFEWWWQVDAVQIGSVPRCEPVAGAFLMGHVYDANTGEPIVDAQVSAGVTMTVQTEAATDPTLADGFYMLFLPEGTHTVQATGGNGYGAQQATLTIQDAVPLWQDFALPAPRPVITPTAFSLVLDRDRQVAVPLTIGNTGALTLTLSINSINAPLPLNEPADTFAPPMRRISPKHLGDRTAEHVYAPPPPDAPVWSGGGKVLQRWATGLNGVWGLAAEPGGTVWVSASEDGRTTWQAFTVEGEPLTATVRVPHAPARFRAGAVWHPFEGRLWQVAVEGDDCVVALDVQTGQVGEGVCPGWGLSQRGLAYDPRTATFYSGSWNDGVIHQFDETGRRLRSVAVGIPVAGMAFNPTTQHLFVLANDDEGFDVYVLDAARDFALLGGFDVPGLDDFGQAGMALLCDGSLAIADQHDNEVLIVTSGELSPCEWNAVPWLTISANQVVVPPHEEVTMWLTFDTTGLDFTTYSAYLRLDNTSPYAIAPVPVTLTVASHNVYLPLVAR
ncbi:MAG: hypothetical protein D6802_12295 [Ardenticatenia bacterium]|nr:MAG: hypothetical protein D6802_12295 [Ardenticatenia bacterium]